MVVVVTATAERFDVRVERFVIARIFVMSCHKAHPQRIQADDPLHTECDFPFVGALNDNPATVGLEQRRVIQLHPGCLRQRWIGVGIGRDNLEQGIAATEVFDDPLCAHAGRVIAAVEVRQGDGSFERIDCGERLRIRRIAVGRGQIELPVVTDECDVRKDAHDDDECADEREPYRAHQSAAGRPAPAEQAHTLRRSRGPTRRTTRFRSRAGALSDDSGAGLQPSSRAQ